MTLTFVRLTSGLALIGLLAACDNSGLYEADVDRSACNPSYSEFYAGAGNLPIRCTPQTQTFW